MCVVLCWLSPPRFQTTMRLRVCQLRAKLIQMGEIPRVRAVEGRVLALLAQLSSALRTVGYSREVP